MNFKELRRSVYKQTKKESASDRDRIAKVLGYENGGVVLYVCVHGVISFMLFAHEAIGWEVSLEQAWTQIS